MAGLELDIEALVEGDEIEAKAAQGHDGRGAIPRSIWETYSAFANSYGGSILLGVKEHRDRRLECLGLEDPESMVSSLWSALQNPDVVSRNILGRDDLTVVEQKDARVIVMRVPPASRSQRPVFVGRDPLRGTYKRLDEGDYLCRADEVQRMFADAAPSPPSDAIIEDFTIEDLEPDTIARFRRRLRDVKPDHPALDGDDEHLLLQLRALVRDRSTREVRPTVAGLVMFGTSLSIRERLPHHHLDYQERSPHEERWSHRIHSSDGTWSGNLFDFYTRVIRRLHDGLEIPFRVEGDRRVDDTPVHKALREALANTLSHADHEATTSIVIEKWPDRYLFRNPGRLRVPIEAVYEGGHSDPRNPILHQIFIALGIAERSGLGVPQILKAWKKQHWRRPKFSEALPSEETLFELHTGSLLPEKAVREVERLIGEAAFASMTHEERVILVAACENDEVTHKQLRPLVELHARDLTLLLRKFVHQDILLRQGQGAGSSYRLNDRHHEGQLLLPASSQHNGPSSQQSELEQVAAKIRARARVSPHVMRDTIVALCAIEPLTLSELAGLLDRPETSLQNHYLSEMIRTGTLEFREPTPTHPKQRYVSPGSTREEK